MIDLTRFSRGILPLALIVTLPALSGCKQMSSWTNTAPSVSTPSADPFGYPPSSDTYLHRPAPESEPVLSPVPPLPAPGHSDPLDIPPPPVPSSEGADASAPTGNPITARLKAPWNFRPISFFQRKQASTEPVPVVNDTREPVRTVAPAYAARKAVPLPLTRTEPMPSPQTDDALPAAQDIESVSRVSNQPEPAASAQPEPLDPSYTGPIITPGSQYTIGRDTPIEPWPYAQPAIDDRPAVRLRKPAFPVTTEDFAPRDSASPAAIEPVTEPSAGSAVVPLLLPPGS